MVQKALMKAEDKQLDCFACSEEIVERLPFLED